MRGGGVMRRCQEVIAGLALPVPFTLEEFCARVGRARGRSIVLVAVGTVPGAPSGMWLAAAGADYICYPGHTTRLHQAQVVLHEVCHILLGHTGQSPAQEELGHLLAPGLGAELAQMMLARACYASAEEREAEVMASLIMRHAFGAPPPAPAATVVAGRVSATWGSGNLAAG